MEIISGGGDPRISNSGVKYFSWKTGTVSPETGHDH
jgi:hypothetical protein